MSESSFFERISAYIAENKRKTALEARLSNMTIEAIQREAETTGSGIHLIPQSPEDMLQAEKIVETILSFEDNMLFS